MREAGRLRNGLERDAPATIVTEHFHKSSCVAVKPLILQNFAALPSSWLKNLTPSVGTAVTTKIPAVG